MSQDTLLEVLLLLTAAAMASAEVVTDGATARSFLGADSGRVVYTRFEGGGYKNGRSLWYVDLAEDSLVERQVCEFVDVEPRNAAVSPDGRWVAFSTYKALDTTYHSQVFVCSLVEHASEIIPVGEGAIPRWWSPPGSGDEYLIYCDADMEENRWQFVFPSRLVGQTGGGVTYCHQLDSVTRRPVGERKLMLPYYANGGRSEDGRWMFQSGRGTGTYEVPDTAVVISTYEDTFRYEESLWGCQPSISPHDSSSDVRTLHLGPSHLSYVVCDVQGGVDSNEPWVADGINTHVDFPEWSSDPGYIVLSASPGDQTAPFDVYIVRISDHVALKVLDGNNGFPYLWVGGAGAGVRPRGGLGGVRLLPPGAAGDEVLVLDLLGRGAARGSGRCRTPVGALACGRYLVRRASSEEVVTSRLSVR